MPDSGKPRARPKGAPPEYLPWHPPEWEIGDAGAVQALARGEATPEQQVRAIVFLVERLCATYDLEFHPAGDRASAFAGGRRFVGLQIVKLTKLNLAKFRTPGAPPQENDPT